MKLFKKLKNANLFKKREKVELDYDIDDLKKIKKKDRKRSLRLLQEYKRGIIISIDKDINQKEMIELKRKEI